MISNKSMVQVGLQIFVILSFLREIHQANVENSTSTNSTNTTINNRSSSTVPTESFRLMVPSVVTASFIVSLVGVIFNALLIAVIIIDPLRILRKGPWVTIINLAFADLLTCIATALMFNVASWSALHHLYPFILTNVAITTGQSASFFLLTVFTVEIYIITKFPLRRKFLLTRVNVFVACACTWVLALAIGSLGFYTILVSKGGLAASVIWIAWIGLLEVSVVIQVVVKALVISEILKSRRSSLNNDKSGKHRNIAKTVLILNLILMITAFPYFVGKQLEYLGRLGLMPGYNRFLVYNYVPVATMNYVANPFLYAWRLPDYRRTLLACFMSKNRRQSLQLVSIPPKSSSDGAVRGRVH